MHQSKKLLSLYSSPETLLHMRQCEAREWISRHRQKAAEVGMNEANAWWKRVIQDIERRRGLEAADELRKLMNIERKK